MTRTILALAAALLVAAAPATAAPSYDILDVGALGGFTMGVDVNSSGTVVGQSGDHAFVWTQTDGLRDLGTFGGPRSGADHVTEAGLVVGYSYLDASYWHPFTWTPAGGTLDLGTLGSGNAAANDVADSGQVVGQSNWTGFPPALHAFSWTAAGGMVDLGTLMLSNTTAQAVNDVGQVVGWSGHAFLWSAATGMRDLGLLPGGHISEATDVNDSGQVVGWADTFDGVHAFSWTETGGMADLGAVGPVSPLKIVVNEAGQIAIAVKTPSGENRVLFVAPGGPPFDIGTLGGPNTTLGGQYPGHALNDAGQLVGYSTTGAGATHAFVWSLATGMLDLGTLGGTSSQAAAISGNGLIVGTSTIPSGGMHAALWALHRDVTPPVLDVPTRVDADATGPAGAVVSFDARATDDSDGAPIVECTPAPGSLFAIGATTVTCVATDSSSNTATKAFVVYVRNGPEQAARLADVVEALPIERGLATSLSAKLAVAEQSRLRAFVHEVDAQTGKALVEPDAAMLRASAERIIAVLGG